MAKIYKTISLDDLKTVIGDYKENRTNQLICTCPFCHKEKHFYIDKKTQLWDCKKCQRHGSIFSLLKQLDKTYLLGDATVERVDEIKSIRIIEQEENTLSEMKIDDLPIKHMPVGFKVKRANEYLKNRGISDEDCKRYNIGYTNILKKYQNYILIPIYDNNKIRGFIGRFASKIVPDNKLRYNNSISTEFGELMFGYDEIIANKTSTVIIVEGVFDKIAVDKNLGLDFSDDIKCVCTFGKKISDIQIKKLLIKNVTRIIVSYDFDALKEIRKYGLDLNRYFETYIAVCTFKKDIDECNHDEVLQVFENMKSVYDFNNGIIGKLKR